jgi:hypothetical protein
MTTILATACIFFPSTSGQKLQQITHSQAKNGLERISITIPTSQQPDWTDQNQIHVYNNHTKQTPTQ